MRAHAHEGDGIAAEGVRSAADEAQAQEAHLVGDERPARRMNRSRGRLLAKRVGFLRDAPTPVGGACRQRRLEPSGATANGGDGRETEGVQPAECACGPSRRRAHGRPPRLQMNAARRPTVLRRKSIPGSTPMRCGVRRTRGGLDVGFRGLCFSSARRALHRHLCGSTTCLWRSRHQQSTDGPLEVCR